jgi:3-hydroxymyristoyl/3-hydroxydecanoyl-(acyl carrier protein) dehydratase
VTAAPALPHGYPFRFVDIVLEERNADFSRGRVRASLTANARAAMGSEWRSPMLLAETIAQAALLLEGGDPEIGRSGFLAGLEDFRVRRLPRAGDTLTVDVRLTARLGPMARFDGEVTCGGEELARGAVLVRKGEARPVSAA